MDQKASHHERKGRELVEEWGEMMAVKLGDGIAKKMRMPKLWLWCHVEGKLIAGKRNSVI